jgi:hypothetical protein
LTSHQSQIALHLTAWREQCVPQYILIPSDLARPAAAGDYTLRSSE